MKTPTPLPCMVLFLILTILMQCSIIKKDSPEKDVQTFLADFQAGLAKTDNEILSYFKVKQTREAILAVIAILQNKDPFVNCEAAFSNAAIAFEGSSIKVEVPVNFRLKEMDSDDTEQFTFVLWLTANDHKFTITQLDGEGLYQAFTNIKNRNEWEVARKTALNERLWIYECARKLQDKFDSVIWYSVVQNQKYFYVVNGSWNNYFLDYETEHLQNTGTHMGLVNAQGEIIIPIEYDLIGSIGFRQFNLVEIKKEGKVGYFDIKKKQLVVQPEFDLIIPYDAVNVWAIVRKDTTYGWLDNQFVYQPGFPSEQIKTWVTDFEFLKENVQLKASEKTFCEIPSVENIGNGIIVPPAYLSTLGIFKEIEGNISTTAVPLNGWTEYKKTTASFLEKVTSNIRAIVTTVKERYLDGREEFYETNKILFVNHRQDTLGAFGISGQAISLHTLDSTLLEVRTPRDYWFGEYDASEELNLYEHTYFAIAANKSIKRLNSERLYPQTQYVKLDSSYLTGSFELYDHEANERQTATFLSVKTIAYMRDEILASYGYRFPDEKRIEQFRENAKWYTPTHQTIAAFESEMTSIDKHNLAFLNKVLALLPPPSV